MIESHDPVDTRQRRGGDSSRLPAARSNPFAVDAQLVPTRQLHLEDGEVLGRGFLYRKIRFGNPVDGVLTYNGWWFLQRLELDGQSLWRKISWLRIDRRVDVTLPSKLRTGNRPAHLRLEFEFARGLRFRRVRIFADDRVIYDEVN